jgi:glucose/mannose transport system permease protein
MRRSHAIPNAVLGLGAVLFLLPFLVMIETSLKPISEIDAGSLFALPHAPSLNAWRDAWSSVPIGQDSRGISDAFVNSVTIAVPALILSIAIGAISGAALCLHNSRTARAIFGALLVCLFIPAQVVIFPVLILFRNLDLYGTWTGVILVHVLWGVPFLTLLFRSYFLSLPRSVIWAAYIDGAGFGEILWFILLPMSRPIFITAVVLQFTYLWNEFLLNLTFAPVGHQPVMVALNIVAGAQYGSTNYNVNMAAAILTALPTMIAYVLFGRYFTRGMSAAAVRC